MNKIDGIEQNPLPKEVSDAILGIYIVSQLAKDLPTNKSPYTAIMSKDSLIKWGEWILDNGVELVVSYNDDVAYISIEKKKNDAK